LARSNSSIAHRALVRARREQRCFVDEVGEIGAGESGRAARDDRGLDVLAERQLAHVDFQDLLASANVGQRHHDLAVEAARAQQRRIEHVRAVRGRDDDHAFVALEAVHLDEQLVEGLLALVVTAAEARAAMAADGVDLVDEDDARARASWPARTCRARARRRRRRTSRRNRNPKW
jgi:hypothetical protein